MNNVMDLTYDIQPLAGQGFNKCIQISQTDLGKSILIAIINLKCFFPNFSYINQMLKTKIIQSNIKSDYSTLLLGQENTNFEDPGFMEYLDRLGKFLVPSNDEIRDLVSLETLSRDLNIKLSIYDEKCSLVIETCSYVYLNPVPVCLYLRDKDEHDIIDYILMKEAFNDQLFCISRVEEYRNQIENILSVFESVLKKAPISKSVIESSKLIKRVYPNAESNWPIIEKLVNSKPEIILNTNLKTSDRSFHELQNFTKNLNDETRFLKKFAPRYISEYLLDPIKIFEDNFDDEDSSSSEDSSSPMEDEIKEIFDGDPITIPAQSGQNPPLESQPSPSKKIHCDKCRDDQFDDVKLDCDCQLSFVCLEASINNDKCVNCNHSITPAERERLSSYI